MKIDSPFIQSVINKKDKLIKIRKKIYKYLQKQNKMQQFKKVKINVMPILQQLEIPSFIRGYLKQMKEISIQQLSSVSFPMMMGVEEIQSITKLQQQNIKKLDQASLYSYTPTNKKSKRLVDITNTHQSLTVQKRLFSDSDSIQLQQMELSKYKCGKISYMSDDIPLKLNQLMSQQQYCNILQKQRHSSDCPQSIFQHDDSQYNKQNIFTCIFK